MPFLHGVEVVEIDDGPRPIQTVRSSVIGLVGTAPDADAALFPLDTPVLIAGRRTEAAGLDTVGNQAGTLPKAIDGIFDQAGAMVVVVRVDEGADDAATQSNVIGGISVGGAYEGLHALLAAESVVGLQPRLIIAPGFSHVQAVATEMEVVATRLRGTAIIDGPNTTDADALAYAGNFGSATMYMVDPWVRVWDTVANAEAIRPASDRVAGMISYSDNKRGFWWSPSNQLMRGILGTARPVDFKLGDANARANYLNENNIATIINQNGFRLWGNRTLSSDPTWQFLSVRRTANILQDSLQAAHLWAVDRNITKTYFEDVAEGVNSYLRTLKAKGAILGGRCWADQELNTPANLANGEVYFDFDFTPPTPAEHVTFRSRKVNDYFEEIFS